MKSILKKIKLVNIFVFLCSICFFSNTIFALSSDWIINEKSKVRLISPKTSTDNSNEIIIGLEYQLDPGWKTYWKSPGGGGFPQSIIWNNSINVKDIEIEWPIPKEFEILGLSSLGYEDRVIFPLIVNLKNKNENTILNLNTNFLVCKDICIPGNANLYLDIPSGEGEYTNFIYDIEKTRSSLPLTNINLTPLNDFSIKIFENSEELIFNIDAKTETFFSNPNILIHTSFGLPINKPKINYSLDYKKVNAKFNFNKKQFDKDEFPIEVILYDTNHNYKFEKIIKVNKAKPNFFLNNSLLSFLIVALIGGFILNLMPCVFPVLSIKLLSVLNSEAKNIRLSFFITAVGIVSSFLILGLIFLLLREFDISISWGMQFQEPYFLIFILIVITFFAINTLGYFEIRLPSILLTSNIFNLGKNYYAKNFFNGFFATLLATPCSAPFIGTAITAAFTQSQTYLILIFLTMGFGMSIPYLLIIAFPRIVLKLPKPGSWMNYVKYFLSLLFFLTALWILNILYSHFNYIFIISFFILLFITIISLKTKFYQTIVSSSAIFLLFLLPILDIVKKNTDTTDKYNWINFNDISIKDYINNDNVIFLDITADWCITCQFNKVNVINTKRMSEIFSTNNVILVKADWTTPNEKINNFLKKFNKFGIPFNALYSRKYPNGIILSEILTQNEIETTLETIIK